MNTKASETDLQQKIHLLEESLRSKEAEINSLTEKVKVYNDAAKISQEGFWTYDVTQKEGFLSTSWKELLGYSDNDIHSSDFWVWESLLHPDDREKVIEHFNSCILSKNTEYVSEFRLRHKNLGYIWISSKGAILRDKESKASTITGVHKKVNIDKEVESKLIADTKRFSNLYDNSLFAIFRSILATGEIIFTNSKFWELFDISSKETVSTRDFYKNQEDREDIVKELLEKGFIEKREVEIVTAKGENRWVSFAATYSPETDIIEAIVIDIHDTKLSLVELQKVNFELDNFIYHASHDLRSPLRSILGLLNILGKESSPKGRETVIEMIEGSIKRLDDLVMDLLSMSRNSRTSIDKVDINFLTEINNSVNNFYHELEAKKNLQIKYSIRHANRFKSDLTRLRIILNNLISNAIKYRSYEREMSTIFIGVEVNEDNAVFKIEDNGLGIPADKQEAIFDMFYRASEQSEGSGLGLYIVKNVLEKIGGKIQVQSEENVGTTFTVTVKNFYAEEQ
ncbi:MAG: PAS domain-containing protein [Cyclobacteriaceae bacterium]|nr:PAS domain-containing protein [Cyclobacteriaceae bacterium]MCH8517361.1 PAS domain-containing protein [Cyclobacteriaceae bacterium]